MILLIVIPLAIGVAWSGPRWTAIHVELPQSDGAFPPGEGVDIANSQCLICHSAGMVLRQPALTHDQWVAEVNKMRSSYGAPIPAEQVEALASYLASLSGSKPAAAH
jgi:mono/diheme cytochrome c family protein